VIADLEADYKAALARPVAFPLQLHISFFPEASESWSVHFHQATDELLEDVRLDLSRGVSVRPSTATRGDSRPQMVLFGARWRVILTAKTARHSSATLAVAQKIERLGPPTGQHLFTPRVVAFHPIWDEVPADPAEWLEAYLACSTEKKSLDTRKDDAGRRLKQARTDQLETRDAVSKSLTTAYLDATARDREEAHAKVRRSLSALRVMLDLLRQRSEAETHRFPATAIPPPTRTTSATLGNPDAPLALHLSVGTAIPDGVLSEDSLIEIHTARRSRPIRARIRSLSTESERTILELDIPADAVGDEQSVHIQTVSRFGMWSHQQAIQNLLSERVEGYWPDLVRLICAPQTLSSPTPVPIEKFFCDITPGRSKLNDQQRRAVAGAMGSEHAFCIQGPPGTGKTTVICELVQQMISRGQRVLVVAPTHAAIDEVLRRIGSLPGIRALRLSWDDSKVAEDVRRYMPSNIIEPYLARVADGPKAQHPEWTGELASLKEAVLRLESLQRVRERAAISSLRLTASQNERETAQRFLANDESSLDKRIDELTDQIAAGQSELEIFEKQVQAADATWQSIRNDSSWASVALGVVGFGALGSASRKRTRLRRHHDAKRKQQDARQRQAHEARERLALLRRNLLAAESAVAEAAANVEIDRKDVDIAERSCRTLTLLRQRSLDREDTQGAIEEVRIRTHRVESYLVLSSRFDELVCAAHRENRDPERLRGDLLSLSNLFCCTTTGIAGSRELRDLAFDTLIVDEASRVTDSEFLIGAVRSRRWILVGDEHQLPPYVEQNDEHFIHALSAIHRSESEDISLGDAVDQLGRLWEEDEELHRFRRASVLAYAEQLQESGHWESTYRDAFQKGVDYLANEPIDPAQALLQAIRESLVHSLFERVVSQCPPSMKVRLVEQRRMIEPLASIVSEPVYKGDYLSPPPEVLKATGVLPLTTQSFPTPVTFLDTSLLGLKARDELQGNSFVNQTEARWIVDACRILDRELTMAGSAPVTVSILAFYKAQTRLIRTQLEPHRFTSLRFSVIVAIDRIQGQESDVVFLSFCRTGGPRVSPTHAQWLQDLRRLNVACTRAHRAIVFVGQKDLLSRLCANPEAMCFYKHLNALFESRPNDMRVVRQFGSAGT
jgi:hypothetical protein